MGAGRTPALVLLLVLALLTAAWPMRPLPAHANSTPDGPDGTVLLWFRPEGPMWFNESYSLWPANTTEPTGNGTTWTFTCTGGPYQYGIYTFYTGGVAWVTEPLAGDLNVSGTVEVHVWLNSTQELGPWDVLAYGAVLADVDEEGDVTEYWYSYASGELPDNPGEYVFELDVGQHVFEAGHVISVGIGVACTEYGYPVSVSFGGANFPARAELPVVNPISIEELLIYGPDAVNRTKFVIGEGPITFNITVSDPFGNLDVSEVRVTVYNETHVLFNRTAEALTNRTAFTAVYQAAWDPEGVKPGNYTVEVRAVDNSGLSDVRTGLLKFVSLGVGNWSYSPKEVKPGLETVLVVSFTNIGTDVIYNASLSVLDPGGFIIEPSEVRVGNLEPGEAKAVSFNMTVPQDLGVGRRTIRLSLAFYDFRGFCHRAEVGLELEVMRLKTALELSIEPGRARALDPVSVSVSLADEFGRPLAGLPVLLYVNGELVANLTTDEAGGASFTLEGLAAGTYHVRAVFEGDQAHEGCEASGDFTLRARESEMTVSCPEEVEVGEEFRVVVVLRGEDGEPIADVPVRLYVLKEGSWTLLGESRTSTNGTATFSVKLGAEGNFTLKVEFPGNEFYEPCDKEFQVRAVRPAGPQAPQGPARPAQPGLATASISAAVVVCVAALAAFLLRRRH